MRYSLLVAMMLLVGCVGSDRTVNPMRRCTAKLWWQASTAGVTSNNPWNKFVRTYPSEDTSDPWANFQQPKLFPDDFVPAPKRNNPALDQHRAQRIIPNRQVY